MYSQQTEKKIKINNPVLLKVTVLNTLFKLYMIKRGIN